MNHGQFTIEGHGVLEAMDVSWFALGPSGPTDPRDRTMKTAPRWGRWDYGYWGGPCLSQLLRGMGNGSRMEITRLGGGVGKDTFGAASDG